MCNCLEWKNGLNPWCALFSQKSLFHRLIEYHLNLKQSNGVVPFVTLHSFIIRKNSLFIKNTNVKRMMVMSYLDFSHSLNKKEYMIGRSPETDYYIITYKENKSNYLVLLLKNHKEIHRNNVDGLTKAKFYAFETLLNIDKKMFENKNVTMLHYKDDRPNGNPWVKDTVKELNKNLEEYYRFKGYKSRENIKIINKKNSNESIENLKKKFHLEMLNITKETKKFGYNPTRFK